MCDECDDVDECDVDDWVSNILKWSIVSYIKVIYQTLKHSNPINSDHSP